MVFRPSLRLPVMAWRLGRAALLSLGVLGAAGCAETRPAPVVAPVPAQQPAAAPQALLPLNEAVADLATRLVTKAKLPPAPASGRYPVVVDPWIDRATGVQVASTRLMAAEVAALAPVHFPMLELLPFNQQSLEQQPIVLLGAIERTKLADGRAAYRIYGALADLRSGTIASQGEAWVRPDSVDMTPAAFYRESPVLVRHPDPAYLRAASQTVGQSIDPGYREQMAAATLLVQGIQASEAGRHEEALTLYERARALPGGDQFRTYSGLYMENEALGRRVAADAAFGHLVEFGLRERALGLKLLFRPAKVSFQPGAVAARYPMWLRQIARHAGANAACLTVTGNASPTGSSALNDRLSVRRAQVVAKSLLKTSPGLQSCLAVTGVGDRFPLVGSRTDDALDALDRRVEIAVTGNHGVVGPDRHDPTE